MLATFPHGGHMGERVRAAVMGISPLSETYAKVS
jgi:hypothetical protein